MKMGTKLGRWSEISQNDILCTLSSDKTGARIFIKVWSMRVAEWEGNLVDIAIYGKLERAGLVRHAACFVIPLYVAHTVYPKKYANGFCFAVLCCGYTLTDFPISIRLTSLALWQSNDCPSASKATLMNMDKYFMWIHYERLHKHNKAKHNKTVCIFLGIYCISLYWFRVDYIITGIYRLWEVTWVK